MRLPILIVLSALGLAAQQKPVEQPPAGTSSPAIPPAFARIEPKHRYLTPEELKTIDYINLQWENFSRKTCASIHVEFDDCDIRNGVVYEKPKAVPVPAAPAPVKKEDKK